MGWMLLLAALVFPAIFCAVQTRRAPYFASAGSGSVIGGVAGLLWGGVIFDTSRDSLDEFALGLAFVLLPPLMGGIWATIGAYAGAVVAGFTLGSASVRERMMIGAVVGLVPGVMLALALAPQRTTRGFDRALGAAVALSAFALWPLAGSLIGALTARRK